MTMPAAGPAIIVTAVSRQTTGMGGSSDRPADSDQRAHKRNRHDRADQDDFQVLDNSAGARRQI